MEIIDRIVQAMMLIASGMLQAKKTILKYTTLKNKFCRIKSMSLFFLIFTLTVESKIFIIQNELLLLWKQICK